MKRYFAFGISFVLAFVALTFFNINASAQSPLLVEDFNYPSGALLTANNWTAHSGAGTNAVAVTSPGLTLTGYPSSGIGNAASLTTTGEDVNRVFAVQSTGSVYAAFLVNTSEAAVDPIGGYFFHLGPDPIGTTFRGRVFIKKDASNNISFGLSKALTTAADVVFTPFSYSLNTTYLVVIKYTIVDGATNDTVSMWIGTNVPASEPAATLTATDLTQTDITVGSVALRQGATATSPTSRVDGIRVGTTWASVTQGTVAPTSSKPYDFDGDGKDDISVYRGGTWFLLNSNTGFASVSFGNSTDKTVAGDYDGDNKTDVAVFRDGAWIALRSSNNAVSITNFGQAGDVPVVGDYDGDNKTDYTVFRNGNWFTLRSSDNGFSATAFGLATDKPVSGKFDADTKTDIAVFRNGNWFILNSSNNSFTSVAFGTTGDIPVAADYDGDGKTDTAVYRSGNWYIINSSNNGFTAVGFGISTDTPVPADYDGDNKADIAVFRTGNWYRLNSSNGAFAATAFGTSGDKPIPAQLQ